MFYPGDVLDYFQITAIFGLSSSFLSPDPDALQWQWLLTLQSAEDPSAKPSDERTFVCGWSGRRMLGLKLEREGRAEGIWADLGVFGGEGNARRREMESE